MKSAILIFFNLEGRDFNHNPPPLESASACTYIKAQSVEAWESHEAMNYSVNYSVFIDAFVALWHSTLTSVKIQQPRRNISESNCTRYGSILINSTDYPRVHNESRITFTDGTGTYADYRRSLKRKRHHSVHSHSRYKSFAPRNSWRRECSLRGHFRAWRTKLYSRMAPRIRLWTFGILQVGRKNDDESRKEWQTENEREKSRQWLAPYKHT